MKQQIRVGVFETNSSSTHAVSILTEDEYNDYIDGNLMVSRNGEFITKEEYQERIEAAKEVAKKRWEDTSRLKEIYKDFDDYMNSYCSGVMYDFDERNMDIEHSERTVNGDKVHAISVYGYEC